MKKVNILILSVGTRNKIISYFKENLNGIGNIIVTDMDDLAPALYEANNYYIVPAFTSSNYIEKILEICKKEKILGILSLIDPELSIISKNKQKFEELGITVLTSSYEICEISLDKYLMYKWLKENNYNCAKSWIEKKDFYKDLEAKNVDFPVFIKPVKGSASNSISKIYDKDTLNILFKNNNNLMIQEFLDGEEIGADVYIDIISGEVVSIFTKRKLKMRAGETDKAVSFKDTKLFELIEKFCKDMGYRGQIDIDIFKIADKYYISEVNPRFGGGYPHAYEAGCNHIKFIINNLQGNTNQNITGNYSEGIYMMKYNEVCIRKRD